MKGLEPSTFCMAKAGGVRARSFGFAQNVSFAAASGRVSERQRSRANAECSHCSHCDRCHAQLARPWVAASRTTPLGRASDERELRTHQSRAGVPNCSRRLLHQAATAPRSLATFELKSLDNPRRHARRRSARLPKCATRSPPRLLQLRRRRRKSGPTLCSPRHLRYVGHSNGFDVLRLEVDRELRSPLAERQRRDSRNGGFSTAED
jgi:hypothetical protein